MKTEPMGGFEPPAYGLRNRCSTPELHRQTRARLGPQVRGGKCVMRLIHDTCKPSPPLETELPFSSTKPAISFALSHRSERPLRCRRALPDLTEVDQSQALQSPFMPTSRQNPGRRWMHCLHDVAFAVRSDLAWGTPSPCALGARD